MEQNIAENLRYPHDQLLEALGQPQCVSVTSNENEMVLDIAFPRCSCSSEVRATISKTKMQLLCIGNNRNQKFKSITKGTIQRFLRGNCFRSSYGNFSSSRRFALREEQGGRESEKTITISGRIITNNEIIDLVKNNECSTHEKMKLQNGEIFCTNCNSMYKL